MDYILKAVEKIESGYRLPPPPGCPRAIYKTMIKCWYVIIVTIQSAGISKQMYIVTYFLCMYVTTMLACADICKNADNYSYV